MSKVTFSVAISLDGFLAGPNQGPDAPLGEGGDRLHEWMYRTAAWQRAHGREGGEANADSDIVEQTERGVDATLMGRRMFGGGEGEWDLSWRGWWGDEPPFRRPVFVLTHHEREPLTLGETTFTFVTDGFDSALEQARAAAGDGDVRIGGGGSVIEQALRAGAVDEFELHVAPLMLGAGTRPFEAIGSAVELKRVRVADSPAVTHLRYRVTG